ncbi:MAG: DUF805 domain-containing protein [Ginsengibacter sp.]
MKYYVKVLKEYVNFKGRARRSEYWYFFLFNLIFAIIAVGIDNLLGTTLKVDSAYGVVDLHYGYVYILYLLAIIIPGLAVSVRRLHDVGKSGWFYFIAFIPFIGGIWLLILFFTDSVVGENKWGPNPKGIGNFDDIDQIGSYITK